MKLRNTISLLTVILALLATRVATADDGDRPKSEKVTYVGISAKSVDAALAAQLNLPDGVGLTVVTVDRDGPAKTDIKANDVLQKLDDQILIDAHQLVTLIRLHHAGDTVTLTLIRGGKPMQVKVTLGEKEKPVVPAEEHATALPGDESLDEPPQRPLDVTIPGVALSFSDDTYSAYIDTDRDGHKRLTVKDLAGKTVTQSPVDTPEQWAALSPDIRKHLEMMHQVLVAPRK